MSQATDRSSSLQRVVSGGKRTYAWLALIGLGFLIGLYGVLLTLLEGTTVLGVTNQVPWGILISTYVFFALLSTGICIGITSLSSVFDRETYDPLVKRGILLSLITLAAGGLVIMSGLGQPFRAIPQMLLSPNPAAPMWWMIVLYSMYGGALVAEFYLIDRVDHPSRTLTLGVGLVALIAPVLAGLMLGAIFGTAETRPYYGGIFSSVYLLVTAVFSGVALLTAVTVLERRFTSATRDVVGEELLTGTLGTYLGGLAALTLLLTALRHVYGLVATNDALTLAHQQMLFGGHSLWAVGVGVLVGMILPLALLVTRRTRTVSGVFAASVLVLVGMFASRLEFVFGGQIVALTNDPSHQYPVVSYVPSVPEIAIVVMGFALFAFLYTVGRAVFDLDELPDHGETPESVSQPDAVAEIGGDDDD